MYPGVFKWLQMSKSVCVNARVCVPCMYVCMLSWWLIGPLRKTWIFRNGNNKPILSQNHYRFVAATPQISIYVYMRFSVDPHQIVSSALKSSEENGSWIILRFTAAWADGSPAEHPNYQQPGLNSPEPPLQLERKKLSSTKQAKPMEIVGITKPMRKKYGHITC